MVVIRLAAVRSALLACAMALICTSLGDASTQGRADDAMAKLGASGLPLPRFVSLKADRVNLRRGPSTDYPVVWEYRRVGLPMEVIAEHENWRQVRDSEGADGWVFHSLLSGRRTALVLPWSKEPETVPLHERRSTSSPMVAMLQSGVLGSVLRCDGEWCRFSVEAYTGWVRQDALWGVYRGETVD